MESDCSIVWLLFLQCKALIFPNTTMKHGKWKLTVAARTIQRMQYP